MADTTWLDVPDDPAQPLPAGPLEPLDLITVRALDWIMVDVGGPAPEAAYFGGAFRGRYAALSSVDVDTRAVHLEREGGWPQPPYVYCQNVPIPTPSAKGKLQTNIGDSAEAMWALDEPNVSNVWVDRSGNGHDFAAGVQFRAPDDLMPGTHALTGFASIDNPGNGPKGLREPTARPSLNAVGEMSYTIRVYPSCPVGALSQYQYLFAQGNFDDGSAGGNVQYCLNVDAFNSRVGYFAQTGPSKTGVGFQSTFQLVPFAWNFLSLRRTAAGVVTIGVNGLYETSGALALPTDGSTARPHWGRSLNSGESYGNIGLIGYLKDAVLWRRRLTDAEVDAKQLESLGAP